MQKTDASATDRRDDPRFEEVVDAFAGVDGITRDFGKGFGSGALKVNGKIFAMISSKGAFVVKLPKARVDSLIAGGQGQNFNPTGRRLMKEWVEIDGDGLSWVDLAREAYQFVKG